jgi:hypothetical protein
MNYAFTSSMIWMTNILIFVVAEGLLASRMVQSGVLLPVTALHDTAVWDDVDGEHPLRLLSCLLCFSFK